MYMKVKFVAYQLLISSSFVFCWNLMSAQPYLPPLDDERSSPLGIREAYLTDWIDQNESVKGSNWYARWLEEQIQRSTASGQWPDQKPLFQIAKQVAELKENSTSRTSGGWIPVGPSTFPYIPNNRLFRGMGRINTVTFHPTDPNVLWVGVAQGGLWKSTDAGQHWIPLTDNLPVIRISDIAVDPSDTDVIYVCVGDYAYLGSALDTDARKRNTHYGLGVYKTIDGGHTWNPTGLVFDQLEKDASLMRRVFIDPANGENLVAAGISGIFTSADGGENWTKRLDEVMADIERDPLNNNILYASSHNVLELGVGRPAIWKSENSGITWTELNVSFGGSQIQRIELAIAPSNPAIVYALACNRSGGLFGFYKTSNAGQTWIQTSNEPNILHWYAGGSDGGQGTYDLAIMVDPNDANKVYTGGVNMWGSEDGGFNWKRASFWLPDYGPSLHADHHQYKYNPVDQYFYACHDGGINRTQQIFLYEPSELNGIGFEFETVWEDISAGMEISSFYRMDVGKVNGDLIAGAQDNSTYYKRDSLWVNTVLGDGMDCFFHPTDGDVAYTSTQGGRFVRLSNRAESSTGSLSNPMSAESGGWTTPFEQDPFNVDGIYAGFGNVWHSEDRGDTWMRLTDLPSIGGGSDFILPASTLSISSSNPNRYYIAKRIYPTVGVNGEMWTTNDGGLTMENITPGLPDSLFITASALSDTDDEMVWITLGGFSDGLKVFRSLDAGKNWINISFDLPNIPINAIEFVPGSINNEIYIGTDVGVYFTSDDMTTWELYSDELPNVIVTDIVIDSEEEKIYVSTFGRGIWKSDLAIISSTKPVDYSMFELDISPNPTKGHFLMTISQKDSHPFSIQILDVKGRMVEQREIHPNGGLHLVEFRPDWPDGLYFVKVKTSEGSQVRRIVIDR